MMYESLLDAIGNTPLVRTKFDSAGRIYAKLEYLNPGGSVKDRSALFMIEYAERQGWLQPGGTLIDASSGNHGIAVAMIGRIKGYKVIISVSEKISKEKLETLRAYGAEVIMSAPTPFLEHPESYHSKAVTLHKNTSNSFMPNQYFNIVNREAHRSLLGAEIWHQTKGKITHFFAAMGTCGTISGVGEFLKSMNPDIKVIGFDSDKSFRTTNGNPQPYKVEGMGVDFETPVLNEKVIDEIIPVSDDHALPMLNTMAMEHGLLVGPTSGAVAYGTMQYCKNLKTTDLAVFICGDSGRAYLTKGFYGNVEPDAPMVQPAKQPEVSL